MSARLSIMLALTGVLAACSHEPARPTQAPSGRELAARWATQGERFAREGDLVRAEQYLAGALRVDDRDPRILRELVHVCIAGSRLRAASDHIHGYLLRHPESPTLRELVATLDRALEGDAR